MEQCLQCRYFCINLTSDLCGFSEQRARLGYLAFKQIDSRQVKNSRLSFTVQCFNSSNLTLLHLQRCSRRERKKNLNRNNLLVARVWHMEMEKSICTISKREHLSEN